MVSPRKGRWIEIETVPTAIAFIMFLPVRGDGLKSTRSLKRNMELVSPRKGRWIEIRIVGDEDGNKCFSP